MNGRPRNVVAAAKPGQVADDSAAQGNDRGAPLDPRGQQLVHDFQVGRRGFFDASPPSTTIELAAIAVSRQIRPTAPADVSSATVRSVITTARFCGSLDASKRTGPGQQIVADHHVVSRAWQHHMQPPGRVSSQAARVHHLAGGVVRWFITAIDDKVGLGIDRVAAAASAPAACPPGRLRLSSGRLSRPATRRVSVGRVQRSHTEIGFSACGSPASAGP